MKHLPLTVAGLLALLGGMASAQAAPGGGRPNPEALLRQIDARLTRLEQVLGRLSGALGGIEKKGAEFQARLGKLEATANRGAQPLPPAAPRAMGLGGAVQVRPAPQGDAPRRMATMVQPPVPPTPPQHAAPKAEPRRMMVMGGPPAQGEPRRMMVMREGQAPREVKVEKIEVKTQGGQTLHVRPEAKVFPRADDAERGRQLFQRIANQLKSLSPAARQAFFAEVMKHRQELAKAAGPTTPGAQGRARLERARRFMAERPGLRDRARQFMSQRPEFRQRLQKFMAERPMLRQHLQGLRGRFQQRGVPQAPGPWQQRFQGPGPRGPRPPAMPV